MDRELLKQVQDCLIELLLCQKDDPDAWGRAVRNATSVLERVMALLNG